MDTQQIIQAQIDWHRKFNQGCLFATFMATKDPKLFGWDFVCIPEKITIDSFTEINRQIAESIVNPEKQVISFLFPSITNESDLVNLIDIARKLPNWKMSSEPIDGTSFTAISLKVKLNEIDDKGDQIYSWAIGFGPFNHFAATRISPHTELSLVTKSKQDRKSTRLNSSH